MALATHPRTTSFAFIASVIVTASLLTRPAPVRADAGPQSPRPDPGPASAVVFGVYPGGPTGELHYHQPADPNVVLDRIVALRSASPEPRPFTVHVYTSWNVYDDLWVGMELDRYHAAGLLVTLTLRYQPPAGHDGDVGGFEALLRHVARAHGGHPAFYRLVAGNEGNIYDNPNAGDGPYFRSHEAIVRGAIGAAEELRRRGSSTEVGVNMAVQSRELNGAYLHRLIEIGGESFRRAVQFVGLNVYPGVWPPDDSGDPYADMLDQLATSRDALADAGFGPEVTLDILENGFPTPDEAEQARRLEGFVRAVIDRAGEFGVSSYSWFSLWDADSGSDNPFGHYGLLRSDLSPKPAFETYQALLASLG